MLVIIYITNSEIPFIENDLQVYYEMIFGTPGIVIYTISKSWIIP